MKTSAYFIDDEPLQILFYDRDTGSGRCFFDSGLGTVWFDYDLHLIENLSEAADFLQPVAQKRRALDLVFISNNVWFTGGEQLVKHIRANHQTAELPVYCVASCSHKLIVGNAHCANNDWRQSNNCNHYAKIAAQPFDPNLDETHPAHLHGILCCNNIADQVANIINKMNQYWFSNDVIG